MLKNALFWIGMYLLVCILTSVIENIGSTIVSVNDYKRVIASKGRKYSAWAMIGIYFVILGKSFKMELIGNNYHDWLALICLFLVWPIHLLGWILAISIPKLRTKHIIEDYRLLYKGFDSDYYHE